MIFSSSSARAAVLAILLGGFAGTAADGQDAGSAPVWRATPDAVQMPYPDGVPHTDPQGRTLNAYEPGRSFFPIGLYHTVTGRFAETVYSFETAVSAGHNTAIAWGGLETRDVLDAASAAGLQVVLSLPTDETVRLAADHPNVLGFDIDHEPSAARPVTEVAARLEAFQARREEIRTIDPDRAVFTVDSPSIRSARIDGWNEWKRAGDVASFWAYPIAGPEQPSIGGYVGVGKTVALAVQAVSARKPVWFVLQAFEGPVGSFDWRMPDARQARAMAYSALIHGATGIVWFSFDSFVTRNGKVIGISPAPKAHYDVVLPHALTGDSPLRADDAQRGASRLVWEAVARINAELEAQSAYWLSPSARETYTVEVSGARTSVTPLRTHLKKLDGNRVLFGVNVDAQPLEFRIRPHWKVGSIEALAGDTPVELDGDHIVGRAPGFGTFALKLGAGGD